MSRAAILPYPGDPFLLRYWLTLFARIWGSEVDTLYIHLNSTLEKEMVEYIDSLIHQASHVSQRKICFIHSDHQIEHGDVIDMTLEDVEEDLVMLIEDDCYIFREGVINQCFTYLESGEYDVVGSKRGSCSQEILDASKEKYGLDYGGEGDQGCNFWPNLFFSSKKLLTETDRNFAARSWKKGEVVEPLGLKVEAEEVVGDTFVNTSIQIMATVPQERIKYIPQYHGSPLDLDDYSRRRNLWDGKAPWVHVGSLSSGVGGALMDREGRVLTRRKIDPPKSESVLAGHCNTPAEKKEWERRVQWWLTFWQSAAPTITSKEQEFYNLYGEAIQRIIDQYGLSEKSITQRQNAYRRLGL